MHACRVATHRSAKPCSTWSGAQANRQAIQAEVGPRAVSALCRIGRSAIAHVSRSQWQACAQLRSAFHSQSLACSEVRTARRGFERGIRKSKWTYWGRGWMPWMRPRGALPWTSTGKSSTWVPALPAESTASSRRKTFSGSEGSVVQTKRPLLRAP